MRNVFGAIALLAVPAGLAWAAQPTAKPSRHSDPLTGYWCFRSDQGPSTVNAWAIDKASESPSLIGAADLANWGFFEKRNVRVRSNESGLLYSYDFYFRNPYERSKFSLEYKERLVIALKEVDMINIETELVRSGRDVERFTSSAYRCSRADFDSVVEKKIASASQQRENFKQHAANMARYSANKNARRKIDREYRRAFDELSKGLQADSPQSTEDSGGMLGALLKGAVQGAATGYAVKKGALPPSAIYGAGSSQAFSSGQGGSAASGGLTGSCKTDQDALIARMNRLQSSPPAGICANARASHPIHVDMANFYARCPSADPSGQMRRMALDNIRVTKQQMEASCAN